MDLRTGRGGQVGEIVFLFPRRPVFADQPSLLAPEPRQNGLSIDPWFPFRQLTFCHLESASMSSADGRGKA